MKYSALYVLPDCAGIVGLNTKENTPHTDTSRMFASMWGAANHPDAPPVTALFRPSWSAVYKIDRGQQ